MKLLQTRHVFGNVITVTFQTYWALISSFSDIEFQNRFASLNSPEAAPIPQLSSTPTKQPAEKHVNSPLSRRSDQHLFRTSQILDEESSEPLDYSSDFPYNCKPNQLSVCSINFGSLVSHNNHLQLHQFLETHKPDNVLRCETNLNPKIDS